MYLSICVYPSFHPCIEVCQIKMIKTCPQIFMNHVHCTCFQELQKIDIKSNKEMFQNVSHKVEYQKVPQPKKFRLRHFTSGLINRLVWKALQIQTLPKCSGCWCAYHKYCACHSCEEREDSVKRKEARGKCATKLCIHNNWAHTWFWLFKVKPNLLRRRMQITQNTSLTQGSEWDPILAPIWKLC